MQFYNTPFVFLNSESKYMYNHALTHIIKDCLLLCRSGSMKRSQLNIVLHVIMYILSVVHVIIIIFFFRLKHRRTNGNWRGGGRGGNWRGGGRGSSDRDHESMQCVGANRSGCLSKLRVPRERCQTQTKAQTKVVFVFVRERP